MKGPRGLGATGPGTKGAAGPETKGAAGPRCDGAAGPETKGPRGLVHCTLLSLNASTPFLSSPPVLLSPSPGARPGAGSGAGFDGGLGARSEGAGQGGQQAREAAGLEWMMRAPERPLGETRAVEEEEEKGKGEAFHKVLLCPFQFCSAPFSVALIPLWYAPLVVVLGSSARELNPYFKSGDGFPDSAAAHPAADPAAQRPGSARPAPPPGVGDGGASWRLKALRRAKEQAEREGKRLSEVVSDRWGSLSSLTARLSSARAAPAFAHKHAARDRERGAGEDRGEEGEGAQDGREKREREGKLSRGVEGSRIEDKEGDGEGKGWRGKEGGTRDKGIGGRGRWGQEGKRERQGEGRGRRGGRDDGGEEEEDEEEERRMRGGRRGYLEGVSGGARAGMRVPQQESVSWRRRGEGGAPGGRGGTGDKVRDGEGGEGKGSEERKQAWKGVGAWRPGMGVGRRGGWADGVLEEAARSVNAFADDGGFLAQQLAHGPVAGQGAGGAESERGVGAAEEARGADGGRRGTAGERGRDATSSGGAGGRAEGAAIGDGEKSERREGGEQRASEDGVQKGAGEEVGRIGGGESMEGGAERVGGAAVDAGDARVQEILAGGLTANQMAAKAMQLKLMGKAEEADCWQRAAAAKSQPPPPAPPPALLAVPATSTLEPRALGEGRGDGEEEEEERGGRREVVQLPLVDGSGRYLPAVMAAREGRGEVQAGRREKRVERYDVEAGTGKRARGDGHGMGEPRGGTDGKHEQQPISTPSAIPSLPSVPPSLEYAPLTGSALCLPRRPSQQQREKAGQVGEFRRQVAVQQRCQQCIDSPARPRHLVVSVAAHSYLMLPPGGSLLPNHVLIVPSEHEDSMRVVEEAVWDEVRNFKKCLTRMAMAVDDGAGVIFLESAMGVGGAGRQRKHCYVEAIPVPAAVMAQAPLYFKKVGRVTMARALTCASSPLPPPTHLKVVDGLRREVSRLGSVLREKGFRGALDEAESEWSQQHSKRILDTRAIRGGLRAAIPPNFPYFHVEFGLQVSPPAQLAMMHVVASGSRAGETNSHDHSASSFDTPLNPPAPPAAHPTPLPPRQGGYCHVIDDESSFKPSFGRDVIAGMMEMDPERFGGRARARGGRGGVGSRPQEVQQSVAKFIESWKPFDWTKMLDG
ncbi:unnamed protein product [Closterium sp. Naga37s-1]|nr:unnamed protein product [Closterium sp. Naga37s-1]